VKESLPTPKGNGRDVMYECMYYYNNVKLLVPAAFVVVSTYSSFKKG
jgi:hypothetical protein